jgi:hypothetical protein
VEQAELGALPGQGAGVGAGAGGREQGAGSREQGGDSPRRGRRSRQAGVHRPGAVHQGRGYGRGLRRGF